MILWHSNRIQQVGWAERPNIHNVKSLMYMKCAGNMIRFCAGPLAQPTVAAISLRFRIISHEHCHEHAHLHRRRHPHVFHFLYRSVLNKHWRFL